MREKMSVTTGDAFEEASRYFSSQRSAFIEELETDVQNLARSMAKGLKEGFDDQRAQTSA